MWLDQEHPLPAPLSVSFPILGTEKENRENGRGWGLGVSLLAGVGRESLPHHLTWGLCCGQAGKTRPVPMETGCAAAWS